MGVETIKQQTRIMCTCMAAGQSPRVQAWAVAYAERWVLSVTHSSAAACGTISATPSPLLFFKFLRL